MPRKPKTDNQKAARAARSLLDIVRGRPQPDGSTGKPPIIASPEQMYERARDYFEWADSHDQPLTMSALQLFVGIGANGWGNYATQTRYQEPINAIRQIIIANYEGRLDRDRCSGAIFAMKNLAGWRDRREVSLDQLLAKLGITEEKLLALPNAVVHQVAQGDVLALFQHYQMEMPGATADGYLPAPPPGKGEIIQGG